MNDSGSIVEFLYNIVPGILFIILLNYICSFDLFGFTTDSALIIFTYIIVGLFLGFIFQGITKIARRWFNWDLKAITKTLENEDSLNKFRPIHKRLQSNNLDISEEKALKNSFYFMDNYLRADKPSFMPTHFTSRFALWSNILFATLILAIITFLQYKNDITILLLLFATFSLYLANNYLNAFYDAVLRSYYMKEKQYQARKRNKS